MSSRSHPSQTKTSGSAPIDLESLLAQSLERILIDRDPPAPSNLLEAIRYSLLAPGKRIRPRLALACGQMLGLKPEAVVPTALALEMIHCFTLIHDDLPCMDDAELRRGLPSNHKKFGEALAVLAGDSLMALALEVFLSTADSLSSGLIMPEGLIKPESFVAALARFSGEIGARGVIGGQAAEFLLSPQSQLEDLTQVHRRKTGALFSAALAIPADLAGVTEDSAEGLAIAGFGRELGLAFQIADDLEDGKTGAGKPTNILFYIPATEARDMTLQRLDTAARGLIAIWSAPGARPLTQIADEVARKIETTDLGADEKE